MSWYRHGHDIAIDVAQALHFLHSRSIIHFDCKSPNILLSADNRAKLAGEGPPRACAPRPSCCSLALPLAAECRVAHRTGRGTLAACVLPGRRQSLGFACSASLPWPFPFAMLGPTLACSRHVGRVMPCSLMQAPTAPAPGAFFNLCHSPAFCRRCGLGSISVPLLHHRRWRHIQLGGEGLCCLLESWNLEHAHSVVP